ncbi:esterase E4-like [Adelges cooleyi]|uniref:esterase E4-like n=1 Tax=Adelges cooleyi TaxID=133065 RepID=UPI0021801F90|nr:esterase E4-like [Adelges cooleyi]
MGHLSIVTGILFFSIASCNPIIQTENGLLKGQEQKSRGGRSYYSFTGIPYAKPPIRELRLQVRNRTPPPQPVDPWKETLDATKEGNICVQLSSSEDSLIIGDEDCLYLNVYTPNTNGKLPVMFWIHGGGFAAGSGGSVFTGGPDYFMDKDVVLVSINYRLGLLGFLSTEDEVIPGNFGMKDQVMALRWVKENIGHFGGDPSSVTIFGESAGGASTGYHLLSPMSKGLFHKAILQSGTPLCRWAVSAPGLIRQRTEAAATIAGCNIDDSETILECMKSLPANVITNLYRNLRTWNEHPLVLFTPTSEKCNSGAFLCHNPLVQFQQESDVPVIIGVNSAEGGLLAAGLFNDTSFMYPELNSEFNRLISVLLMYNHFTLPKHLAEIGEKLLKKYFPLGRIDDQSHLNAVDMCGDGFFVHCIFHMAVKLTSPVYFYLYDYQNEISFNNFVGTSKRPLGVTHADEVGSLFNLKLLTKHELNLRDTEVSKTMINIWTEFASTDQPTINGERDGQVWPKFTSINYSLVLHVDSAQPKLKQNPMSDNYRFWQELPLLSRLHDYLSASQDTSRNIKN